MSKRRLFALTAVLGMLLAQSGAARPNGKLYGVVDSPATPFSSDNVHFLGNYPIGVGIGGHFWKHYYFATSAQPGSWLPGTASTGGLNVFDASKPETPKLIATLPLPHWQNEDVDVSPERGLLLITAERRRIAACEDRAPSNPMAEQTCSVPPYLAVIDISTPSLPRLASLWAMPAYAGRFPDGRLRRGPGHTVTCVMQCRYAYVSGGRNGGVHVVDLTDINNPKMKGEIVNTPAGVPNGAYPEIGSIHDVNVDPAGNVWFAGSGGTAVYAPPTDPMKPKLVASVRAVDNQYNMLIHHGSVRLDASTVLIGEESFGECGWAQNLNDTTKEELAGGQQGSFQTWQIAAPALKPLDLWRTEVNSMDMPTAPAIGCSAHWFTVNRNRVVAAGWYEQGARLLDVRNPRDIKQIGFWMPPGGATGAANFVPWRSDIVYTTDYNRGMDVLKIDNGGVGAAPVTAPVRAEWLAGYKGVRFAPPLEPDPDFGYACLRPRGINW